VVGAAADVQSRIQAALQKDASLSNSDIRVGVTKDTVELSGVVQSADQEDKARSIAEQNAGGMQVIDHLQVTNTGKPPSPLSVPPR
jgi:osmotically-inducible protein OsmY